MDKYKETLQTWNKVASLYQDKFMDLDLYDDTYDLFIENVSLKHSKLLEIGCGPGNITKYLLGKRNDFNITGIDIAPNMIELAKVNNPNANFKVWDSRCIEELDMQFNGIIAGFCMPYLSQADCSKLITDCNHLLLNSGLLYLSFVEGDYSASGYQVGSSGDRVFFYFHDIMNLKKELDQNDFDIIELIHKTFNRSDQSEEIHTILIARKRIQNVK